MRLSGFLFSAALASGFGLLASSPRLSAQPAGPAPRAAVVEPSEAASSPVAIGVSGPDGQKSAANSAPAARENSTLKAPLGKPAGENQQQDGDGQPIAAPAPRAGSISGTVFDQYGDVLPGATAILEDPVSGKRRTVVANDNGFFEFDHLQPAIPYQVTISAPGFIHWSSSAVTLQPGQFVSLTGIQLQIEGATTSVTVTASTEQIATEQVKIEEQQRVFGIIPNFYVVYEHNPAPMTAKLKFKLALRVSIDPVTIGGVGVMAGIYQAADTPNYVEGAKGYGQRFGTVAADGFTDILIGGAILPSLLHEDPRYFYQGTGSKRSRLGHALASPFICRDDNGKWGPNYSSMGGDLASAALSDTYYPESNRGAGLVFSAVLISTAERMTSDVVQEFILSRFTSRGKK
ncbi:MAG: carboxypeptidase regulatory-like domain-containing protein [Terracidiphilus sp.]